MVKPRVGFGFQVRSTMLHFFKIKLPFNLIPARISHLAQIGWKIDPYTTRPQYAAITQTAAHVYKQCDALLF